MIYFYARTDNRKDLDRLRRSVALAKEFDEVYFMATDFRAASYAKSLGVKKAVGIEDFRNISQVCQRGDVLVFDSDEHLENDHVHQEMIDYFGRFIRISYDPEDQRKEGECLISPYIVGEGVINAILVDAEFFEESSKQIEQLYFWGDADYEKKLLQLAPVLGEFEFDLLEGLYFFAGYADELAPYFKNIYEVDDYYETIKGSKLVVSANPQTALEATAAGAKVIYMPKSAENDYHLLLKRLGIFNMGLDPKKLQEALLSVSSANKGALKKLGCTHAKQQIEKIL